jgi:phospholipase D1/2
VNAVMRYKAFLCLALGIGFLILGLHTALHHYGVQLDQKTVAAFLERARGTQFVLPTIVAGYVLSGLVLFPITVLNLACAMVFGPVWGVLYGLAGSLANAAVYFWLGRMFRRFDSVRGLLSHGRMKRIDERLRDAGVLEITVVRFVPLAPFSLFNLTAGMTSVGFIAFAAGTAFALMPGAVGRGLLGDSLMQIFLHPDPKTLAYLLGGIAFWVLIVYMTHLLIRRLRAKTSVI